MSDLIDRQAAIKAFTYGYDGRRIPETDIDNFPTQISFRDVKKILRELPSAEKTGHWIPVSEGLPKKDGRYQVTRHDYVTNTEFIDILWYEKNTWWDRQATGDYAVTAWMPLPEAYKEGGEKI